MTGIDGPIGCVAQPASSTTVESAVSAAVRILMVMNSLFVRLHTTQKRPLWNHRASSARNWAILPERPMNKSGRLMNKMIEESLSIFRI
jgi:hypothetical protein